MTPVTFGGHVTESWVAFGCVPEARARHNTTQPRFFSFFSGAIVYACDSFPHLPMLYRPAYIQFMMNNDW